MRSFFCPVWLVKAVFLASIGCGGGGGLPAGDASALDAKVDAALDLDGDADGQAGPDAEIPADAYFQSEKIGVRRRQDGTLIIRFDDRDENPVEVEGKFDGSEQVLFDQGEVRLDLTADNLIRLVETYTDSFGRACTSTYTVREDRTAEEMLIVDTLFDWRFHFADDATREVEYTAGLVKIAGKLNAEFVSLDETILGREPVTVSHMADTSKVLAFSNPYGSGASEISVLQPAVYQGVSATLAWLCQMHLYERTDGSYIVDYFHYTYEMTSLLFHAESWIGAADQTIYETADASIVIKPTGEVFLAEPINGGTLTNAVNPAGLVVEHALVGADFVFDVHFVNHDSGELDYTANIIQINEEWFAEFLAPIQELVPVHVTSDIFENTLYDFDFNNAAGEGNVHFWVDTGGRLSSTTLTFFN